MIRMTEEEKRNKIILDSFGKSAPQMNMAAWDKSAETIREAQRFCDEVFIQLATRDFLLGTSINKEKPVGILNQVNRNLLYNQCAYGL